MASSLRFSNSFDAFDSNISTFTANPLQFPTHFSLFPVSVSFHLLRACKFTSFGVSVSRIESETNDVLSSCHDFVSDTVIDNCAEERSSFENVVKEKYKVIKRKTKSEVGFKFRYVRNGKERGIEEFFVYDGEYDVRYSALQPNLSLEQCNLILKRLERCGSDSKVLKFFEWMRSNRKLEKNVNAYNVILRVLGRREDWDFAEKLIRELSDCLGSELDFRVFNTLIYACSKRGLVELGEKWFRMMLALGIQPNIATFGMVMALYQKGWNVEGAEYAFSQMRSLGIICESAYASMITIYTRLRLHEKAERVIGFMKKDKVVLNMENWLVLLNAYSQQGKLDEAEQVMVSMQKAKYSPNTVAYNTLITGYGKTSNMVAAQRLFLEMQSRGLKPDETTYRSLIEGWGRIGNYKEAKWCYKELKGSGFRPNSSNLYTMINLQAEHGDEEGAIRTMGDMLKMGCQYSSILGTLLKAYERVDRINRIPLILKGSFYEHVLVNQTSCSILVMEYVKHNLVDDALNVLAQKKWNDSAFEDNLYHLLICSCKELGHLEDACKIYTQMPESMGKPNLHISCTMMDIYSVMNKFAEGEEIYVKLKTSGIPLDMIAFSIVVRMYVKAGSLKDACSVLETMEKQKDIVPDVYLFRDMLRIYQQRGMLDKLKDVYYKILSSGVVWDQEMYNCVINCCSYALPVDEISRLFNEMVNHGFTPNTSTFNVMLNVYGKAKLFKKAEEVFKMARKQGLLDVISYNTIIAAYGQNKDLQNMKSTIKKMQFDGFSVSLEVYNCILNTYGKEGEMEVFKRVLQRMKESNCASDHYTFNTMINIYGEQGWIDEVEDVLTELKECGLGPDLCSYNTLIKAYGIAGMVEEAVCLVKEMRENGIEPDKITYSNLIAALRRNDEHLEAVKWSLWLKQIGL